MPVWNKWLLFASECYRMCLGSLPFQGRACNYGSTRGAGVVGGLFHVKIHLLLPAILSEWVLLSNGQGS